MKAVTFTSIIVWYCVIIGQNAVIGQVCVETKMVYRDIPETYLYTYTEAYMKSPCLFWCTDTRVATATGTRTVRKLVPEYVNVCCEGYTKDDNPTSHSIHCEPVCSPSCSNGYCKSPGECACNHDYIPDAFNLHNCLPLCIKGCDHGTCTAPNICQCDLGYKLENEVCEPVCSEPCHDGTCVAPEICQCYPGYKKSENNICEPFCSGYTAIGECIVTITCEPGWTKVIRDQFETCEPMCAVPCVNGTCTAPDHCECLDGYKKSLNDICEPYCSTSCSHGSCISPETCVCDPGWYKSESSGTCRPHCDVNCGNGACVAPNVCECFAGYELIEFKYLEKEDTALCAPVCTNCEGSCIAPGRCVCESPQEASLVSVDGGSCNCLDNCSADDIKCERTICLPTTTTISVTGYIIADNIKDVTASADVIVSIEENDESTINSNFDDFNEVKMYSTSWYSSNWCYATGSILILIVITVTVILKRKNSQSLHRNMIFNTNDNEVSTAVHYKQNTT